MSDVRQISACRLCAGADLRDIIDFGFVPLGNNLQETADAARAAAQYPLGLRRCSVCGHFQLSHAVTPKILYATNYTYLSGIGASFVKHFADYAAWIEAKGAVPAAGLVVDVGSNDGTCLKAFRERGFRVCGIDPATLPAKIANESGIETLNTFFSETAVEEILSRHGHADFVTSHNVLAHVDNLAETFANIYRLLKPGGYFCFEVGYFREVLSNGYFDTIYHEHLDYHHATPLVRHLAQLGFSIEDISVNTSQGGSIRLLSRKSRNGGVSMAAQTFVDAERDSVLYDGAFLKNWRDSIFAKMARLRDLVREHTARGQIIAGYGAPTKATLLLNVAGLSSADISYIVEDNKLKAGRFLPTNGIEIRSAAGLSTDPPDALVLFAWNFADDIIAKLRGSLAKPTGAIVPLPEPRMVQL